MLEAKKKRQKRRIKLMILGNLVRRYPLTGRLNSNQSSCSYRCTSRHCCKEQALSRWMECLKIKSVSVFGIDIVLWGHGALHWRQYLGQLGSVQLLSLHDPRKILFVSQHKPLVRHIAFLGQQDKLLGPGHGISAAAMLPSGK